MNHTKCRSAKIAALSTVLAVMTMALAACQSKVVRPTATTEPILGAVDTTGAIRYQVDSAASDLRILVYRGGSMARLGHNHVVSSKEVKGALQLHADITRSHLALSLPVKSLIVDDPQTRAAEGDEFSAEVPVEAREGTRRNLLRAEILDAEHFPVITLQSVAVAGTRETPSMIMRVTIKDVSRDVVVLATVQEDNDRLVAEGEFAIQQSDFGITPFSVGLGALQVLDKLRIRFRLVAVKT